MKSYLFYHIALKEWESESTISDSESDFPYVIINQEKISAYPMYILTELQATISKHLFVKICVCNKFYNSSNFNRPFHHALALSITICLRNFS